ncbi:MAG: hypothetical protein KDE55_20940 [Novosphingobium sp.]|nr:hypothetical protein [Novosphingobium sp.]
MADCRLLLGAAVLALASCKPAPAEKAPDTAEAEVAAKKAVDNDTSVACALDGAEHFSETCTVEKVETDGAGTLVVRHPDGSFRRFTIVSDGRGLVVSDGAEDAEVALDDGMLDVSVDDDHYLFPATLKNDAPAP